jgi:hypothetical protein
MHAALRTSAVIVPATDVPIEPRIEMSDAPLTPTVSANAPTRRASPAAVVHRAAEAAIPTAFATTMLA